MKVLKKNKKRVGRLRFKGKGWFKTINYNKSGFSLDKENKKLNLSKIGNIKIKQKKLSKKKKGSNNRKKTRKSVAKLYEKITNVRRDFLHKLTTKLIKENKFIAMEKLDIKQMSQKKYFNARNMLDCSWGEFGSLLNYKAENAGCLVVKVNPQNTSKMCLNCGNLQDMPLWKRTYECDCGLVLDRDYNSAKNIINLGQELSYVENNSSVPLVQGLSMKQEAISFM